MMFPQNFVFAKGCSMQKSIRKLVKPNQVLYTINLDEDLTKEGFTSFASSDVYSLPVSDSRGNVVGLLDHVRCKSCVSRVFSFFFFFFLKKKADFTRFVLQVFSRSTPGLKVSDVMNASGRNALVTLPVESATIGDAVSALVEQNLHRICVTEAGRVKWLVSQWDVINFFADRLPKQLAETQLCDLGSKRELDFLGKDCHSIDEHDSVLHAFQLMDRHCITAVPVVSSTSKRLVGTISLKDVPRVLDQMFEPCGKLLTKVHDSACVELDSTFGQLLRGFQVTRLHRFWILGDVDRLTGVISLTDALRCLKSHLVKK
jgi:CBS-domain-containing membrane protein